MYREETRSSEGSRSRSFFIVLGMFFAVFVATMVSNYCRNALQIYYTEYIVIALAVILCAFTMKKIVTRYAYVVQNGELMFYRLLGKREKLLAALKMNEILYFGPEKGCPVEKYKTNRFLLNGTKETKCITYQDGKQKRRFIFAPSDKLSHIIEHNQKKRKKED